MKEEFNLSDKEQQLEGLEMPFYSEKDVKEFIRLLKERFGVSIINNKPYAYTAEMIYKQIDKLAGDKII